MCIVLKESYLDQNKTQHAHAQHWFRYTRLMRVFHLPFDSLFNKNRGTHNAGKPANEDTKEVKSLGLSYLGFFPTNLGCGDDFLLLLSFDRFRSITLTHQAAPLPHSSSNEGDTCLLKKHWNLYIAEKSANEQKLIENTRTKLRVSITRRVFVSALKRKSLDDLILSEERD